VISGQTIRGQLLATEDFADAAYYVDEPRFFHGPTLRDIGGAKMADRAKDKKNSGILMQAEKTRKRETPEVCEICGREMERDPESGEKFCPDCYYSDDKV
jgi:hypothetical protein